MSEPIEPSLDDLIARVQAQQPGATELVKLAAAVSYAGYLGDLADNLIGHFVDDARSAGASWSDIGQALGVSKQGAQQRFVPRGPQDAADLKVPIFSRFTDRARKAIVAAQESARQLSSKSIGTEHVLLGIIADPESIAVKAMRGAGVSPDEVRRLIEDAADRTSEAPAGHIPFTARAKTALELTMREALKLGHNYIGTEHLILAISSMSEGTASDTLSALGATYDGLREQVLLLLPKRA